VSCWRRPAAATRTRPPEKSQQAALRALGDAGVRAIVERFVDAFDRADVDAMVALLAEDATFLSPPTKSDKAVTPTTRASRTVSFPRFGPPAELAA
jgi:ketosteroid isomerase-like protein